MSKEPENRTDVRPSWVCRTYLDLKRDILIELRDGNEGWTPAEALCLQAAEEIEGLRVLVSRLTNVADSLASDRADPGSEPLAAIYCGRHFIYG